MKTENLEKAAFAIINAMTWLRAAHTDSIRAENRFAEIAMYDLLTVAADLERKLDRVVEAAKSEVLA